MRLRTVPRLLLALGLAPGPAGNSGLQLSKHLQIDVVSRAVLGDQVLQALFVVIFLV